MYVMIHSITQMTSVSDSSSTRDGSSRKRRDSAQGEDARHALRLMTDLMSEARGDAQAPFLRGIPPLPSFALIPSLGSLSRARRARAEA